MKARNIGENAKRIRQYFEKALGSIISPIIVHVQTMKSRGFAYQLIGQKTDRLLPLFKDLDVNLLRSGLKVSLRSYVSSAILMALLLSVSSLILIPILLFFVFGITMFISILFGLGGGLLAGASTIIVFYLYPLHRATILKRNIEDGLPFTAGYMAILAGAGVQPECIFRSLAQVDASSVISDEARALVRDVELFGFDTLSALKAAADRTPSPRFKELLGGLNRTIHSGGALSRYLMDKSQQYMMLKRISLRRFSDTLSVLAEFYVTLLLAGPLILAVMLLVMAMLGGGGAGPFTPRLMLYLLTYFVIPVGSIVFLIILDFFSPRW